jgi:hypothetical protein
MAKKSKLTRAAVSIGTAVGTAERRAAEVREAALKQQKQFKKKFDAVAKELKRAQKALQKAVATARG